MSQLHKIWIIAFLLSSTICFGQHVYVWEDAQMTFETQQKLFEDEIDTEDLMYDAENDAIGINMELVDFKDESEEFLKNIEEGCREICADMNMKLLENGEEFNTTHKSYYVICFDREPVVTAVIMRENIQKAIEISLYCYNSDTEQAIELLKNIRFDD